MNYKIFFHSLTAPALWQRSEAPFWDDEHISQQMLAAHLNPDIDAASRKKTTIINSVKWLSSLIPENGRILDLGCGPGLYSARLSSLGFDVTGVDYSRRSIAYAKSKDLLTKYHCGNYLDLCCNELYDAVLLIYCDFAALTLPERQILLPKIYQVLKSGGVFIFDVFTEAYFAKLNCNNTWKLFPNGGFYSSEPYALLDAAYLYQNGTIRAERHTVVSEQNVVDHIIWNTAYDKSRLLTEVQPFSLHLKGIYDDITGTSYTGDGDTLCFVLQKP